MIVLLCINKGDILFINFINSRSYLIVMKFELSTSTNSGFNGIRFTLIAGKKVRTNR